MFSIFFTIFIPFSFGSEHESMCFMFSTCFNSFLAVLNRSKLIYEGLESKFSCNKFLSFSKLSLKAVNCFFFLIQYGINADLIFNSMLIFAEGICCNKIDCYIQILIIVVFP